MKMQNPLKNLLGTSNRLETPPESILEGDEPWRDVSREAQLQTPIYSLSTSSSFGGTPDMKTQNPLKNLLGTSSRPETPPESILKGDEFWRSISREVQMQTPKSSLPASSNETHSGYSTIEPIQFESSIKEEILGWWTGTVTAIKGKTFLAELCDLEDRKSMIEMERRAVGEAQEGDIQLGARLVYSISRKEDSGGAKVESQLQFLPPYLWSLQDEKYIEKRVQQLYEDDSKYFKS